MNALRLVESSVFIFLQLFGKRWFWVCVCGVCVYVWVWGVVVVMVWSVRAEKLLKKTQNKTGNMKRKENDK